MRVDQYIGTVAAAQHLLNSFQPGFEPLPFRLIIAIEFGYQITGILDVFSRLTTRRKDASGRE